ncbi:hypothetical protein K7640_07745 [Micromonospora sp. PLK6-60]|uniref:hypothetical protein n=1 Tax=Micromonospora sp. PLK6-60 TaxID=2873383 RepID=UPI001CA79CF1|nr:hypothetical protein [Micromonospora sp. PLK6-60]MBY8871732.1 hypothetical protein [Micromonospora sp. PLK6-60]
MQNVLSSVLLDVPQAAVIWLALLVIPAVAVAGLVVRPSRFRSAVGGRIRQAVLPTDLEFAEEQREQNRYAEEIAVAAEGATGTAERRRAEWVTAQDEVESAWQAYQEAEAVVRRLDAAAGMPLPRTVRTPAEYADRERFLHRTARATFERGELSAAQLDDALAHRNGWDPRLHPVEQELVLRRAVRDNLLDRHRAAHEREQRAWRAAELAATAARSLREEARRAAGRTPEVESVSLLADLRPTAETSGDAAPAARRAGVDNTRELPPVATGRAAVPAF